MFIDAVFIDVSGAVLDVLIESAVYNMSWNSNKAMLWGID